MNKTTATPLNTLINSSIKVKHFINQEQTIFQYLLNNIATNTMVSEATGIPQKNICRYKRDFEKKGLIYEAYKGLCKITGFKAWYLTANKDLLNSKSV